MTDRRRIAPVIVLILFGTLSLISVLTRSRMATYYPPDIVQVFGSGLCFGVAIGRLTMFLRSG